MSVKLAHDNKRPSFDAAAKQFGHSLEQAVSLNGSLNNDAMQMYAIGFLSKMTKKEINAKGRDASGVTEQTWKSGKVTLSKCHRAIAGEYGFGDKLALAWAVRDFTVSLDKAYDLSAAPRKDVDNVLKVARILANMSSEEQQAVIAELVNISFTIAEKYNDVFAERNEVWQDLVKTA